METRTVFQTLDLPQVSAILDEIAALDGNLINRYDDAIKVLGKRGISEADFLSYCEDPGDDDPFTEAKFARSLLACFLCGLIDVRDVISKGVVDIGYAVGQTASHYYYHNAMDRASEPNVVKRWLRSNIYLKEWDSYRLGDLADRSLNGRLRGNHEIGVYEKCDISDYDYAVYYATGGSWLDYDGMDWMAGFYADFAKTPGMDAVVETVCRMLPGLYLKYDEVVKLHSSPDKARQLADKVLKQRAPTMPKQGEFSENVFLPVAKTEFWLCLFTGPCGFHKFYIGEIRTGILYLLTYGGFCLLWLYDVFRLLKKMKQYSNKREYLKN